MIKLIHDYFFNLLFRKLIFKLPLKIAIILCNLLSLNTIKLEKNDFISIKYNKTKIFIINILHLQTYIPSLSNLINYYIKKYHFNLIKFQEHDVIIDVGAGIGFIRIVIDTFVKNINYICFEPDYENFKLLKINLKFFKNLISYNCGVFNKNGKKLFYQRNNYCDSSFFKEIDPKKNFNSTIVPIVKLDKYLKKHKMIKLLKIDAEGANIEILKSAGIYLSRIIFISVDVSEERIGKDTFKSTNSFLKKNNFNLIESFGVSKYNLLYKNIKLSKYYNV
jgi:hypothetical protein